MSTDLRSLPHAGGPRRSLPVSLGAYAFYRLFDDSPDPLAGVTGTATSLEALLAAAD